MKTFAFNRQAGHHYTILETFEAGLVLNGAEVKAIRAGQINLKGSYIAIKEFGLVPRTRSEAFLVSAHISLYSKASLPAYAPDRERKLLLRRKEIQSLKGKLKQRGLTLVPLKVYNKNGLLKLEFGLAKGKKQWDKRETIKRREAMRNINRTLKNY